MLQRVAQPEFHVIIIYKFRRKKKNKDKPNFSVQFYKIINRCKPGRVAQSVGHLTRKSGVLGSIPGLATYFRFSFRFFKKGSCQLLAKICARSTG